MKLKIQYIKIQYKNLKRAICVLFEGDRKRNAVRQVINDVTDDVKLTSAVNETQRLHVIT